ncbi:hypothetical protein K3495_g13016 [Podosphaera aphanis]|nr:hypothetical protein K3495_g13016 [Podosphaera aphanis]
MYNQRVTETTEAIQNLITELIPKAKPSKYAKPYWTKECSQVVKDARKARRRWTQLGTEDSWVEYNKATNRKKKQIKKDKVIGWRITVTEVSQDPKKMWKLAEWARKSTEEKQRLPQIPEIRDATGTMHTTDIDKAKAMAQHFFPLPIRADV